MDVCAFLVWFVDGMFGWRGRLVVACTVVIASSVVPDRVVLLVTVVALIPRRSDVREHAAARGFKLVDPQSLS